MDEIPTYKQRLEFAWNEIVDNEESCVEAIRWIIFSLLTFVLALAAVIFVVIALLPLPWKWMVRVLDPMSNAIIWFQESVLWRIEP